MCQHKYDLSRNEGLLKPFYTFSTFQLKNYVGDAFDLESESLVEDCINKYKDKRAHYNKLLCDISEQISTANDCDAQTLDTSFDDALFMLTESDVGRNAVVL